MRVPRAPGSARHVGGRLEAGFGQPATATALVALTAVRMRSATAFGCESAIECDASTSTIWAPARLAMWRSAFGGIALSEVATTAQEGSVFQAAASARSSKIAAK